MRIVHVVPQVSAEADGVSAVVRQLCLTQVLEGHQITLACLDAHPLAGVQIELHKAWPLFGRCGMSPKYLHALRKAARRVDVVHNHSLWSMVNMAAGLVVPGKHAKLVTSPHGTLSEWALSHHRWRKQVFWPLQKRVLEYADLIHATCEDEYNDIRRLGLRAPVTIISNGIDLPDLVPRTAGQDERILLFLSRVHPKKGIELLLDAWAALDASYPQWRLRIVGPGEPEYLAVLHARVARNGSRKVSFDGPLYGDEKIAAYRNADLFVLPTHSENFGMVVAEALAQECPAIVSHGAPWSGLDREGCGWWIPNDVDSLRATLEQAMAQPPDVLHAMGARGRQWMQRDFSWEGVAGMMEAAYRWVSKGGECLPWIRME